ncbi:MAG: putative phage abortive infection protein [Candidatus Thiodiazotropha taylori]|nr:putative phage abortive infection protein [Candidatus Thiodiazotropha endolucinida]MCW4230905.1 putative phage abortive infection protein [Candidatus Thiodiazotropha taylori]
MSNSPNKTEVGWILPITVVIIVILLWVGSGYFLHDLNNRGSFGDMFGAVNALFSGLAFAGVIFAILLQRKELSLQRNELELTRIELAGQKTEMELQNKTLFKQSFENTFFQLLSLQQEIINGIDLSDPSNRSHVTHGRDCIKIFFERFRNLWNKNHSQLAGNTELERINKIYLGFYDTYQSEIGHYFRSLYHIIKLIDKSEVENKRLYTNLVRAQLSSYELTMLFYNCLSDLGAEKFKPLVEKYALLKNMPKSLLINQDDHKSLYEKSAFG